MDRIREVLENSFPVPVTEEDGKLVASYGALERIEAWISDKKLYVDTIAHTGMSDEMILETNKMFRKFLDGATGYSAKKRAQMTKKEVQE